MLAVMGRKKKHRHRLVKKNLVLGDYSQLVVDYRYQARKKRKVVAPMLKVADHPRKKLMSYSMESCLVSCFSSIESSNSVNSIVSFSTHK